MEANKINDNLLDIFNNTKYITLSTTRPDGSPYATPLGWFAFDGKNILFDNRLGTIHSDNLKRDPRCFITIVNYDRPRSRAVYIDSVATNLEGEEYVKAKKLIEDRGLRVDNEVASVPIGAIDQEKSQMFRPPDEGRFHCYMSFRGKNIKTQRP